MWNLEEESSKKDVQPVQIPETEMSKRAIILLADKQR